MTPLWGALAALALLCQAPASAADTDADERRRIAADRQAVQARFDAARRDCETRFLVNNCLDQALHDRRQALEPLQRQLHLLDDARRRERAVERLQAIQARESAMAALPALAAVQPASAASAGPRLTVRPAVRPAPAASAESRAAAQRAAQYQQRLQEAQAHQEAVLARNARRDAQRKPAAGLPLPVPGAASP